MTMKCCCIVTDDGVIVQLLYISVASDAYEGFLRALAVVMETHMPRIPLKKKPTSPTPGSVCVDLAADAGEGQSVSADN